ncbi:MAG: pilus assembly protein N-terminal domain-containing protein [Pseudomonadota bacterium]|nr:pilus assembly protein N-terminal domain-containing protein [Pseudomonadota bacterium]
MPLRRALTASLFLLAVVPGAAAQSSASAPQQRLSVELGRADREIVLQPGYSDVLQLPRPARTIILGSPDVADATLNGDTTVVLTGQKAGQTNLIILDAAGAEVTRAVLRVGPRETRVVIRHGAGAQSYTCKPACTADPTAANRITQYSGPWGSSTVVTTTGEIPPGLMTPPPLTPAAPQGQQ